MPWPTNSRTTENPCCLDVRLHRVPDVRDPGAHPRLRDGRGAATPRSPAAARPPRSVTRPTGTVTAASPKNPSSSAPRSIETMSPSTQLAARRDPVHHLFVHRRADRRRVPVVALERRLARRRRARASSASASSSAVVTPGRHALAQLGEHLGHQRVGGLHPLELRRRLADDHAACPSAHPAHAASAASMCARRSAVTLSGGCSPSIDAKVGRSR